MNGSMLRPLALLLVVLGTTMASRIRRQSKCKYDGKNWNDATKYFLDCMRDEVQDDLDDIRNKVDQTRDDVTDAFYDAGSACSYHQSWEKLFAHDTDLVNVLADPKNQLTSSTVSKKNLRYVIGLIEDLVFDKILKDEGFAICLLNELRDIVLDYMERCMSPKVPGDFEMPSGLQNMPLPHPEDSVYLREFAYLFVKAYVVMEKHCSASGRQQIISDITQEATEKVCDCASDGYYGACGDAFNDACPKVDGCIRHVIDNPSDLLIEPEKILKNCKDARDKNGLKLTDLITKGLAIKNAFEEHTTHEEREKIAEMVKRIIKAHFKDDFCQTCRV